MIIQWDEKDCQNNFTVILYISIFVIQKLSHIVHHFTMWHQANHSSVRS